MTRVRGFSLIELIVAAGIGALIMTGVVSTMVTAKQQGMRNEARGEMAREAAFVNQLLAEDLRATGLGVPGLGSTNLDGSGDFTASVLVNNADSLMILGDRQRPDAQYNTFGLLHHQSLTGTDTRLHWSFHNENNGTCAPNAGSTNCSIGDTSLFFPGIGNVCDSTAGWTGDPQPAPSRGCPWGMKRVRDDEIVQIVSGSGQWANFDFSGNLHDHGGGNFIQMLSATDVPTPDWDQYADVDSPPLNSGEGWVTTLDRVIWRFDPALNVLFRNQCWGPAEPNDGNWDSVNTPSGTCTGDEVMLDNVASVNFAYFDGVAAPATSADIDRIEWLISQAKPLNTITIRHAFRGTVGIRNPFQ